MPKTERHYVDRPYWTTSGTLEDLLADERFNNPVPGDFATFLRELNKEIPDMDDNTLIENRVLKALNEPQWDFRTVGGIARETGLSEEAVRKAITNLGNNVRRPLVPDATGRELYTLSSRKPNWRERYMRWRQMITKSC